MTVATALTRSWARVARAVACVAPTVSTPSWQAACVVPPSNAVVTVAHVACRGHILGTLCRENP